MMKRGFLSPSSSFLLLQYHTLFVGVLGAMFYLLCMELDEGFLNLERGTLVLWWLQLPTLFGRWLFDIKIVIN